MTQPIVAAEGSEMAQPSPLQLHVIFNNVPYRAGLTTSWGFFCLIEGLNKTILFDTGGNGSILLSNMQQLDLDVQTVEVVVLSHIHGDHTGGLGTILAHNPNITVYMPESFPAPFQQEVRSLGASPETVSGPRRLFDGVYSTGEMGWTIKEQALIVDTSEGLVVITGCAHPDIAKMAEHATQYLDKNIYLLMGGFHLAGKRDTEIQAIVLGVRTFPTQTYFFLADFAPYNAADLAARLEERGIFIKPLNDPILGSGFMRVATALPDDNERVVAALKELL